MNENEGPTSGDLGTRLQAGESIESILFNCLAPPTRTTLMRCVVVRTFDQRLYDDVLCVPGGPPIAELAQADLVEDAGCGRYRVAGLAEVAYATFWAAEGRKPIVRAPTPAALADVARDCAQWFDEHDQPWDRLDALLQSDPEEARRLFTRLFDDADSRDDLAGCHDALDVLERADRIPLYAGTGLAEAHLSCRARLAARTRWARDYSASAQYFPRRTIERHLEGLLSPGPPAVIQMFARGGMGKTMQLRWFLGRRCAAAAPRHIPCASIDFDHEDAGRASRNPWLVALRIAEQLEGQLVGDHFRALLESHGALVPLLYAEATGASEQLPPMPDDVDGRDVVGRIAAVLAERSADDPVVVVVDTCEELLRPGIDPGGLFAMLADLTRAVPALRLVLAGRYDLTTHSGLRAQGCNVAELFPSMQSCRLPAFNKADRRRYLVERRRLPEGPLVDIIVQRTARSPFHLATFADLARLDPDMTVERLQTTQEPGLLYLIERILNRVEDDVRWLLLYGVIPRRLSFRFLEDVMWRFLAEGMAAPTDGASTKLPLQQTAPPRSEIDIRALWDRMLSYASKYSWVWVDEEGDLRFHPDVLEPLRAVARESSFYKPLHEDAIRYYENHAASDAQRWAVWTAEALYHRFQLEGPAAEKAWRDALARAQALGDNDAVRVIALEPLRREYLDEDDQPRVFRHRRPIVTWEVVVAAHVHLALAAADRAGVTAAGLGVRQLPATRGHWTEVQRHLRAAREIAEAQGVALPQPETDLVETRAAIATGDVRRAADLILNGERGPAGTPLRTAVDLTQRFVRQLLGESDAWVGFEEGWSSAESSRDPGVRSRVALARAAAAADRGQYQTALKWLGTASKLGPADDDRRISLHADALTSVGSVLAARQLLHEPIGPLSRMARVKVELAADRPAIALREINTTMDAFRPPDGGLESALYRLRSTAHADLLQIDEALADLHLATATARSFHDPSGEAAASAQMCLLHLRQIGDLRNAAACIRDALDTHAPTGSFGWLDTQLALAELHGRRGDVRGARATIADIAPKAPASAAACVQTSVAALLAHSDSADDVVRRLVGQLDGVEPRAARVVLLGDLAHVPDVRLDPGLGDALRASVAGALEGRDPQDQSGLAWRLAALERVLGDPQAARRLLTERVLPQTPENPFLWWRVLQGLGTCGTATEEDAVLPDDPFAEFAGVEGLRAAWLIRLVQWRWHLESPEWSRERLSQARTHLRRPQTLPTHWGAELDETWATLDRHQGSTESARSSAATASVLWARLGQPERRFEIATSYQLGKVEPAGSDTDVELRVWFGNGAPDRADINVAVSAHGDVMPAGQIERTFLAGRPPTEVSDTGTRLRDVSGLIAASWGPWATSVGRSLSRVGLRADLWKETGELRLVTEHLELAALPWELVTLPEFMTGGSAHKRARHLVYRCLGADQRQQYEVAAAQAVMAFLGFFDKRVDGLVGSEMRSAVAACQETFGLPPTGFLTPATWKELRARVQHIGTQRPLRVLIIAPPPSSPGSANLFSLMGLAALYASTGAVVETLELSDLLQADLNHASRTKPDVVHLLANIDLVGGNVVIDTGAASGRDRTFGFGLDQLAVTVLGDFLAALSKESFGPAVIVETPWRPSRVEAARALLLRNVLGHILLELGRTEAVLCTGGASPARQHDLRETIVNALAERNDLAQVAARLQATADAEHDFEDAVSRLGTTLFVQRSPHTLFPVGCA